MERWTRAGMLCGGWPEYRGDVEAALACIDGSRQAHQTATREASDASALSIAAGFRENGRPNSAVSPR
jgi:hypothetical protein